MLCLDNVQQCGSAGVQYDLSLSWAHMLEGTFFSSCDSARTDSTLFLL